MERPTRSEMLSPRLQAVSLRDMKLVLAVQRRGAFRPVARDMAISASGLSHQVRKVEEALDCVLFDRSHHAVRPTVGGLKLLRQIARIVDEAEVLTTMAGSAFLPFGGALRVGANTTIAPYILPSLQRVFHQHYPGVTLHLSEGMTNGPFRRLEDGEIDVLISSLLPDYRDVETTSILEEGFSLLIHRDIVVDAASIDIAAGDLAGTTLYVPEDMEVYGRPHYLALASAFGSGWQSAVPNITPIGRVSLESLAVIAAANRAAALVPHISIARLSTLPDLRVLTPARTPLRTINISWRTNTHHLQDLRQMATLLAEDLLASSPAGINP